MQSINTNYQWQSQVASLGAVNFSQVGIQSQSAYGETSSMGTDELSISSEGMQMAGRMMQMRQLDTSSLEEESDALNTTISNLGLADLSDDELSTTLSEMEDEELLSTAESLASTLDQYKPDDAPELDFEGWSDEELTSFITDMTDRASELTSTVDDLSAMASGDMPPMGPPPAGPPPSGTGESSTEDTDETDLLAEMLERLEEAREEEEADTDYASLLGTVAYDYLMNGYNSTGDEEA